MRIAAMTFRLRAPWVHSLKEKRTVVKSLATRLQNKFHISAAEVNIYYKSKLAQQINDGSYGIENMDYRYLVQDLIENEPELFE